VIVDSEASVTGFYSGKKMRLMDKSRACSVPDHIS